MKITCNGFILFVMSVVLFAAASNTQSGWQYIISSFLMTLVIVGFIAPFLSLRKVSVAKAVPSILYAGKDSTVELSVINHSQFRKTFFDIQDTPLITSNDSEFVVNLFRSPAFFIEKVMNLFVKKDFTSKLFLKTLPAGQRVCFRYDFSPSKRGVFKTGPIRFSSSSPLGLFSVSKSFNPMAEIVVYPMVHDIRGGWINRVAHRSVMSEFSYSYIPTSIPGTTRGLRGYVPGDSPRHIHWPTSAKTGNLLVREFEIESSGFVYIVLDSCSEYESEEYFELAVSAVASMLNACHLQGLFVSFATQPDSYDYPHNDRLSEWDTQLEVLARVKPVSNKPVCKFLDSLNHELISENRAVSPIYILVAPSYKAEETANKFNVVSVTVSSFIDSNASYSITCESDLKYI